MLLQKKTRYSVGVAAEEKCKAFLEKAGFRVLAQRYKVRGAGEIDLIATRDELLLFIEVKQRATLEGALESITTRQQTRITDTAQMFIAEHEEYNGYDMRFDVMAVVDNTIHHLENAWGQW